MSRVIVALDFDDERLLTELVEKLNPKQCKLKVGKEVFTRCGPQLVKRLSAQGFDVFLDLKFHDIPNTVAKACLAAADLGVWMMNVHASGGLKMMEAAKKAVERVGCQTPLLIGVTVLTSFDAIQLSEIGITSSLEDQVTRLAKLSQDAGLDGVVCSALEASCLKSEFGDAFCLVTPGIRLSTNKTDDQVRIMTPGEAIRAGSDYLVIGRPITQAEDPCSVIEQINAAIDKA